MNGTQLVESMEKTFSKGVEIVKKKNHDYTGGGDHNDAFYNFRYAEIVGVPIERGILVRMTDKMARVSSLLDKEPEVVDEKLDDTLLDLINYAAILKAYLETKKKTS